MSPRPHQQRGAAAVEFAIALPVLLVFTLGLLDCGRLVWNQTMLSHAVEAAARCGAISAPTCGTTAATRIYAANQATGMGLTAAAFTATASSACAVQVTGMKVTGTMGFTFFVPWFYGGGPPGNAMTLNATACYPV